MLMNMMANGKLTYRINVKSKNELGQAEANYNVMADQISSLIKGVEEKSGVTYKLLHMKNFNVK